MKFPSCINCKFCKNYIVTEKLAYCDKEKGYVSDNINSECNDYIKAQIQTDK